MRLPLRTLIPAAALVAAAAAAPSADAAGWVTGAPLSPPDRQALAPMLAVTPSGDRVVAWEQRRDEAGTSRSEGIAARIAPAGATFGAAQIVSEPNASDPSLATGEDGTAVLSWFAGGKLHVARRTPGAATFTEAAPLPFPESNGEPARIAIDGGDAYLTVATRASAGSIDTFTIRALRLRAGATAIEALPGAGPGGALDAFSFNHTTQPTGRVADPTIAIGAGTVHVAWELLRDSGQAGAGSVTTVRRAARPLSGGAFGAPVDIDTFVTAQSRADRATPQVVGAGNAVELAWLREQQIAVLNVTGGRTARRIATAGGPFELRAGIDRSGALTLAWQEFAVGDFTFGVFGARLPADAPTTAEVRLTRPNSDTRLDAVAVGADGSAVAVPDRRVDFANSSATTLVQGVFASPGATFGAAEEVSGPRDRVRDGTNDSAAAAVGADGRTFVAWGGDDEAGAANDRIFLSERDGTAPAIGQVSVPADAAPGAPVAFAAEASDTLSPVTLAWDFGDGSHATGGLVSHTYGAAGTYTATVTARDGAGNVATEQRVLKVAVPAGPGGAGPDRTAPRITGLKTARPRFRSGSRGTALVTARKKTPAGTTFNLNVDERATLVVSFTGKVRRRKVTVPGVLIRARRGPGAVSIPFSGRVGGTRLAPGSYRASFTAIDGSGNRSRPSAVSFTVVPR